MRILTQRILFIFSLFLFAAQSYSQSSMTDEQVVRFVLEQQEKGANQEQIVTKLLQKGVTPQQLRRVRKNYQAEQEQLGAVDVTGKTGTDKNRNRTQKQLKGEKSQQEQNYMIYSQARGKSGNGRYTQDERRQMMNQNIEFLDIDSLKYYQNYIVFHLKSPVFYIFH